MASYFVKYNDVDLTDIIRVRTVETTVLPPRENNSIMIWERPGSIYNSYRYGEREIIVTFLLLATRNEYRSNPYIMEDKLNTLRNVFKAPVPKPLYLGTESRFIYAVPEGDFKLTELRYDCYECEITFICHDPEYYSSEIYDYDNTDHGSGSNNLEIHNGGNTSAYPIINIGINTDNTSFVQVENTTNGNKLLIGSHPSNSNNNSNKTTNYLLFRDPMESRSTWEVVDTSAKLVDSDRSCAPTSIPECLDPTDAGDALTLTASRIFIDKIPSNGYTWKGVCAKRDIKSNPNFPNNYPKDFLVQAQVSFTSTGKDGDPTRPNIEDDDNNANVEIVTGGRDITYHVNCSSAGVREAPSLNAKTIFYLKRGQVLESPQLERPELKNGWIYFFHNGRAGYLPDYLVEKTYYDSTTKMYYYEDGTVEYVVKNVKTNKNAELRSAPTTDSSKSTVLATIPKDTVIRINTTDENGFYKLYVAYNGKIGYVKASEVTDEGVVVAVEYPQDEVTVSADDQMGVCEIYGWSTDGTKLFKLSLTDDNAYSNYVKPVIEAGSNVILQDNTSVPKENTSSDKNQLITDDPLANGSENSWNEFFGELGIQKKNGKWKAWIYKMKNGTPVKKLEFKEQAVSGAPEKELATISIYMGIKSQDSRCSMSISDIKVTALDYGIFDGSPSGANEKFMKGDIIKVDCYNNKVYLNDKIYNNVSIGSNFIELVNGINNVKVTSDDPDVVVSIMFNERYV